MWQTDARELCCDVCEALWRMHIARLCAACVALRSTGAAQAQRTADISEVAEKAFGSGST